MKRMFHFLNWLTDMASEFFMNSLTLVELVEPERGKV